MILTAIIIASTAAGSAAIALEIRERIGRRVALAVAEDPSLLMSRIEAQATRMERQAARIERQNARAEQQEVSRVLAAMRKTRRRA